MQMLMSLRHSCACRDDGYTDAIIFRLLQHLAVTCLSEQHPINSSSPRHAASTSITTLLCAIHRRSRALLIR
jgi:hypothetical protein